MSEPPAILAEGVHKAYGDVGAVAGIDLQVPEGTVLGLLGPNGAGKTTMVRILTTLVTPDSGRATVMGHYVVRDAVALRSVIGLAGQFAAVDENLTGRENLIMVGRVPTLIVFSTISPIMFVLLFRYVFGGAIPVPGFNYVGYLMPGIFVQTIAFGATQTGVGLAEDLSKGNGRSFPVTADGLFGGARRTEERGHAAQRLRHHADGDRRLHGGVPLPGWRAARPRCHRPRRPLRARLLVDVRPHRPGHQGRGVGATFSFLWTLPLTFASSAFVPVASMPGWLQAFAEVNPVSIVVDATRALSSGGVTTTPLVQSLAWIGAILAVFIPLSARKYRRVT